jgi:drug/metabolite transporter (DMT)-like permease
MSPRHRRLLPWLALLVVYVVWGSTYMAIRIAVREMPPFAAAAMRFGASGLVMAAIAFFVVVLPATGPAHLDGTVTFALLYPVTWVVLGAWLARGAPQAVAQPTAN